MVILSMVAMTVHEKPMVMTFDDDKKVVTLRMTTKCVSIWSASYSLEKNQ